MDLGLTGTRALVVGGRSGIGRAAAAQLAREGALVAIAARSDSVVDAAAALAAETGGTVVGVVLDSTDEESVRAGVAAAAEALGGGIGVLVNTAADAWTADKNRGALETTPEFLLGQIDTKTVGYLRTAQAVIPGMRQRGWGRIINISGLGTRLSSTITQTVRNVGVSALTKNLADEFGPDGITAVVVHPGATRTEAWDRQDPDTRRRTEEGAARNSVHRPIDATEVADVIAFLASPRSGAITGDAIPAGGGQPTFVSY